MRFLREIKGQRRVVWLLHAFASTLPGCWAKTRLTARDLRFDSRTPLCSRLSKNRKKKANHDPIQQDGIHAPATRAFGCKDTRPKFLPIGARTQIARAPITNRERRERCAAHPGVVASRRTGSTSAAPSRAETRETRPDRNSWSFQARSCPANAASGRSSRGRRNADIQRPSASARGTPDSCFLSRS